MNNSPNPTLKKIQLSLLVQRWKLIGMMIVSIFLSIPSSLLAHPLNIHPLSPRSIFEISQVFFANSARCNIDDPQTYFLSQSEAIIGDKVTGFYLKYIQKCPDQTQVDELRYFWTKNQEYWQQDPQAIRHFFEKNFQQDSLGNKRKLLGQSIEQVQKALLHSPSKIPSPQVIKDMTWYILTEDNIRYEIVVRNGKVSRIYFID